MSCLGESQLIYMKLRRYVAVLRLSLSALRTSSAHKAATSLLAIAVFIVNQ